MRTCVLAPRKAAITSCAMPPQPMSATVVISCRGEPHAGKLPSRQLFHGVAHAFAADAARADAAERIGGKFQRRIDIGNALHHHHRAESLLAHETRFAWGIRYNGRTQNGALALRLE